MSIDVSAQLPAQIRTLKGKLTQTTKGTIIKYVLEVPSRNYRGFIYVKDNERETQSSVWDLYNNFYFENGMGAIAGQ